jgi:2'-5' RNA ligase
VRLFVALDVPEGVCRAIGDLIGKLERECRGARWARVDGMHVTLKFIGHVPPEKAQRIKEELRGIRSGTAVEMSFRQAGFFPSAQRPRVFWVGIQASPNLAEMAETIEERLEPLGIPRERRPFRPHLTLARFRSEEGLARLRETLEKLSPLELGAGRAEQFYLYESQLKPGGAQYTKLAGFRFAESAP